MTCLVTSITSSAGSDILAAAEEIIAEGGLAALSFREIGSRLGGSTTMVTHFYANQSELLGDFAARSAQQMREEIAAIVAEHDDPVERLDAVLFGWLLPLDDETIAQERMRINFAAARVLSEDSQVVLDTWERVIQESLRELLIPVVARRDVDVLADLLRSAWNGITLSTIEHPGPLDSGAAGHRVPQVGEGHRPPARQDGARERRR